MTIENTRTHVAVLGGDQRQISAANALKGFGATVSVWGLGPGAPFSQGIGYHRDWKEAISGARVLLLPLPATVDGVRLHSPLSEGCEELRLDLLLDAAEDRLLLGGRLSEGFLSCAARRHVECIDYFSSELLQLKNALPTAEAAIEIAMRELPVTVDGMHAAVIGYGRIGALLSQRLRALGAEVSVYARREEALTHAGLQHCAAVSIADGGEALYRIPQDVRVIFNTVPVLLFTEAVLSAMPKHCVFIDLASAPGGIDRAAAEKMGIRVIWATSLPGKYAPETAGQIIAEAALQILKARGFA